MHSKECSLVDSSARRLHSEKSSSVKNQSVFWQSTLICPIPRLHLFPFKIRQNCYTHTKNRLHFFKFSLQLLQVISLNEKSLCMKPFRCKTILLQVFYKNLSGTWNYMESIYFSHLSRISFFSCFSYHP